MLRDLSELLQLHIYHNCFQSTLYTAPKTSSKNSRQMMSPIFLKSLNDVHCSSNKEWNPSHGPQGPAGSGPCSLCLPASLASSSA